MSSPARSWLTVGAVVLGVIAFALGTRGTPGAAVDEGGPTAEDPSHEIRSVQVMSELAGDKPLRLAVSGSLGELQPGNVKLLYASQGVYTGALTADAVDKLIERGRAETLEHRLTKPALEQLRALLGDFDTALRDVSLLINEEEDRVKAELRERADRHVRILTRPRERDPHYLDLLVARAQMSHGRGAVWGLVGDPGEVHVIVRWEEWPALKSMNDDRFYMLDDREKRVREWISKEYRGRGMSMFDQVATGPVAEGSPADGRKR